MALGTLATYSDLVDAVSTAGGWIHRTDIATIVPVAIQLAETTINYGDLDGIGVDGLRTAAQETITTLSTTGGTQTVALPSDLLEIRKIYYNLSGTRFELVERSSTPMSLNERSNVLAPPTTYYIQGSSLYLIPIPDQTYTITLDYYAKVGPLTSASPTNWLLTAAPMVYLAGTIVHASLWMGTKYDQTKWVAAFRTAMSQVTRHDVKKRFQNTTLRSEVASIQRGPFNIMTGDLV